MFDLSFYNGKKVFVTGHTGFKGSWLCKMLVNAGAEVTGYSLEPPTCPALFEIAGIAQDIRLFLIQILQDIFCLLIDCIFCNANLIPIRLGICAKAVYCQIRMNIFCIDCGQNNLHAAPPFLFLSEKGGIVLAVFSTDNAITPLFFKILIHFL